MKVLVALALLGLATVAYASVEAQPDVPVELASKPECPPDNGQYATLLPNPDNCATYYMCNFGNPILMPCPAGLHFNDKEKACDNPARACCDPYYDPHQNCPSYSGN